MVEGVIGIYPYLLMVFVVIFYAGNILTGKALNDLPPLTIAFFRLLVAFIVMIPIGIRGARKDWKIFWKYKKPFLFMTLTGVTFFNTFIYGALQFTTASNVSVLETLVPVVTVVLSAIVLQEKLPGIKWVGVALSCIGAMWVVMDGHVFGLTTMDWNVGDLLMIGAIGTWSVYSILVKQYMYLFHPYGALLMMSGVSVIVLIPLVLVEWLITGIPSLSNSSYIGGFLYLGIFPSLIALIFYNRAVDVLGASQASVFLNFLPVFTMIGANIWLDETITMTKVIGALVVICGVVLTTQKGRKHGKKTSNASVR